MIKIKKKKNSKQLSSKFVSKDVFIHAPRVLFRKTADNELTLLHSDDMNYFYKLDAWAGTLWTLLNGKNSIEKITQEIQKKSGFDEQFVAKNINFLLTSLSSEKLIEKI